MTDPLHNIAKSLCDAISGYDTDAIAALFAPDSTLIVPEHPAYRGPAGAEAMVKDLAAAFVEWKVVPVRIASEGNTVFVDWACTITDFGGSEQCLDGCSVLDILSGKIQRARFYFRPEDVRR
jgi:ketosteroid isomerase-like protein